MRILIASDIHGRLEGAKKLDAIIEEKAPHRVVLLGDFLYNGPRNGVPSDYDPMSVCTILNKHARITIGVRGNCDSRVDQTLLRFPLEDSKVILLNGYRCDLVHGDLLTSELLEVERGDILMFGHTHVPMLKREDGVLYLNPGSISFPKHDNPATYAMMDETKIDIFELDSGDIFASLELA